MYRQASFLVLSVAAGVLIGALGAPLWSGDAPLAGEEIPARSPNGQSRQGPSGEPDSEDLTAAVESLARVLNAEINERRVLTEQVQQLKSELLDLKQNLRVRVQEAFQRDDHSRGRESDDTAAPTMEERLAAAGFTRDQLDSIDRLRAKARMARIELDDRARREGWLNTPRYFEESRKLERGAAVIRDALGDELYDRYLTASGFPNRVRVGSIIETSPAQEAGFRSGDVVISYGGEKVFSPRQLVNLRSSGQRGALVTVEILRNGRSLQLTIPRGPMGMSVTSIVVDPTAPRQ